MSSPDGSTARKRQTRAELRTQVLSAGLDLLREEGVDFKLDNLTFQRVFRRIEEATGRKIVPAMVYERIWANQEAYRWQVLGELIHEAGLTEPHTLQVVSDLVESADLASPEARREALCEICRVAGNVDMEELRSSRGWAVTVAAIGASSSTPAEYDDSHIAPVVRDNLVGRLATYSAVHRWVLQRLGFALDPQFDVEDFTLAVGALADGVVLRARYLPHYDELRLIDLGSGKTPWSIFSIGFFGILNVMLRDDPAFDPESSTMSSLHDFLSSLGIPPQPGDQGGFDRGAD